MEEQHRELASMRFKVPVSMWIGSVDHALTSEYHAKHCTTSGSQPPNHAAPASKSAVVVEHLAPTSPYRLTHVWINAEWTSTVDELIAEVRRMVSEDDERMQDPWVIELLCSDAVHLRTFHKELGVMGENFKPNMRMSQCCSRKRSTTNHFALHVIPSSPSTSSSMWHARLEGAIEKCDNAFHIFPQDPISPGDFPLPLRQVVSLPHGCSVEEAKVQLAEIVRIAPAQQIITAVVGGEPVVRTTGILVGDPIYIERVEAGRLVGNANAIASARGFSAFEDGIDSNKEDLGAHMLVPSRAAMAVNESYKMDVELVEVPPETEDSECSEYIRRATVEKIRSLRADRRITVRQLKRICLHEYYPQDIPSCSAVVGERDVQLWFANQPAGEPKNIESSLYTMCLGAKACRVALVHRPVLADDERMAEVYLLSDPVDYLQPATLLKRIQLHLETTIGDVIQQVFPAETQPIVEEKNGQCTSDEAAPPAPQLYTFRARLVPSGKSTPFGQPMWSAVVLRNAHRHTPSEVLKITLQRLRTPEPLMEKGSLILHVHRWNSLEPNPQAAMGPEHEVIFNKEMPSFSLKEHLSELFDIPLFNLQAAPAKLYMLQTHNSVFGKVAWDVLGDDKVLQRPLAAHPLCIDHDEIILVRSRTDPWPHVDDEVKALGHLVLGQQSTASRFGGRRSKSPSAAGLLNQRGTCGGTNSADDTKTSNKKARSEAGISIRAVWDYEEDEQAAAEAEDEQPHQPSAAATSTIDAAGQDEGLPHEQPAVIDFIESCLFQASLHQMYEASCRICYGEFEEGDDICILPQCTHIFHKGCLGQWLQCKPVCPLCGVPALLE